PEVATSSSSGEKATPAAPALTGERRIRTIFFVATFQMTVFGAFPVTASSLPSWLKASETTYPNGPRRFASAVWSAARQSVTRPGAGEVAKSVLSGLVATAVDAFRAGM